MDRRIAPPGDPEIQSMLDRLTSPQPGRDYPIFETKQKALMFAAGFGYLLSRREVLTHRDAGSAIRFDIFQKAMDDGFIHALAVAEESDLKILDEAAADRVATIFEEYACAGLNEIHRRFFETDWDPLDGLLNLTLEARELDDEGSTPPGIDPGVLRKLLGEAQGAD